MDLQVAASRILDGVGHGFAGAYVTDFGCRSCGLWSYGFVGSVVVLGAEIKGLCRRVAAISGVRLVCSPPGNGAR